MPKTKIREEGTLKRFRIRQAGTGNHLGWIHRATFESARKFAEAIFGPETSVTEEA